MKNSATETDGRTEGQNAQRSETMSSTTQKYDRVFYWTGGCEVGMWSAVIVGACRADDGRPMTADEIVAQCRRMGYVAVRGSSTIGAPEGAPSAEALAAVTAF